VAASEKIRIDLKQKPIKKENIMNKYIQNIATRLEIEIKDQAK